MNYQPPHIADPCPSCGKPDAARSGSTAWGHKYMCCSESCGANFKNTTKYYDLQIAELTACIHSDKAALRRLKEMRGLIPAGTADGKELK